MLFVMPNYVPKDHMHEYIPTHFKLCFEQEKDRKPYNEMVSKLKSWLNENNLPRGEKLTIQHDRKSLVYFFFV